MKLQPVILAIPQDAPPRSPQRVRQQRLSARLALEYCAERCGVTPRAWDTGRDGVPLPQGGLHWSVSHKRQWVAAVIAERPVGIDIEHVVPRREQLREALADQAEWAVMGETSWLAFFRLWTAKEATLKANSTGIAGLSECRLMEACDGRHMTLRYRGQPWYIEHFQHAEHVAAVTCGLSPVDWCVLDEEALKSQNV